MNKEEINQAVKEKVFPAYVAEVIDPYKVVINRGSKHGLLKGQRFTIYEVTQREIKDPLTNKSLGYLEIPKGTGRVIYLQEEMAIVESDRSKIQRSFIENRYIPSPISGKRIDEEEVKVPFESPKNGDLVKPI